LIVVQQDITNVVHYNNMQLNQLRQA